MSHNRTYVLIAAAGSLVAALLATGCARPPVEVTSLWPVANAERTVAKPPTPPRWPYTGKDAPSHEAISRRPLSVKIENSPASRPQLGLNSADVVYETIAEGGITRFNCIFHSRVPDTLGPVRSARLSDLWVVPQYDGLFFFSGANAGVNRRVRAARLSDLSQDVGVSYPYWRASDRSAPHNLMLDTKKAYAEAKKRKMKTTAELEALSFQRRGMELTPTAARVDIPFSQANRVRWEYDAEKDSYLRWNNGNVHRDRASGKQVRATNVVIIWAKYTVAGRDKIQSVTYDIDLGGKGRATILRNGGRIDVTWVADRTAPPRFRDAAGNPVKLASGTTWFQVIPLDGRIEIR